MEGFTRGVFFVFFVAILSAPSVAARPLQVIQI
ncbi:hypothetical protein OPIT5_13220 [Opitutaceae bacterium TAV5]|nr:hypothetical protein OPIT5_13220 [Opitutaceae bacterium TAV5]